MHPRTSRTEIAGADWPRRALVRALRPAAGAVILALAMAGLSMGGAQGANAASDGPGGPPDVPVSADETLADPGEPLGASGGRAATDVTAAVQGTPLGPSAGRAATEVTGARPSTPLGPSAGRAATDVTAAVPGRPFGAPSGPATLDDTPAVPAEPEQLSRWQGIALAGATCGGPPDARSGERAAYKYYLNPATTPGAGILFLLSGGGACMKEGPPPAGAEGTAAQLYCMSFSNFRDPVFTDAMFLLDAIPARVVPYFDRGNDDNPFRDWTFVAVPYCTGDVHAGSQAEAYDYDPTDAGRFMVLHRGHLNVMAVLDDVARRHPGDVPVVLSGLSAGGFGAIFNFPDVVARYPHTTLLPDAGIAPPAPTSLMMREGARIAARWGAEGLLPANCNTPDCLGDTLRLFAAHAARFDGRAGRPWLAFGLLQGQQDGTLSDYLEIGRCSYQEGLRAGLSAIAAAGAANVRVYVPATSKHVFSALNPLTGERPFVSEGGVDAHAWFKQLALASSPDMLPPSVIDRWAPCNPTFLPFIVGEPRR